MIIKNLLKNKKVERTPIWIMRQAGRHLPEYRKIRSKHNLFEMFFSPEIVQEVTLQPVNRYDLDAAIIFSDILVIPYALGMDLNFSPISKPKLGGIEKIDHQFFNKSLLEERLDNIYKSIKMVKKEINNKKPLIGFSGGTWTTYLYMLSEGSSINFPKARAKAFQDIEYSKKMLSLITEAIILHLEKQIKAGADIVKIFESETGTIGDFCFEEMILEPTKKIVATLKNKYPDIEVIYFPRGASFRYKSFSDKIPSDVIAIDHLVPVKWAKENLKNMILQGNLDPAILFCSEADISKQVEKIEKSFGIGEYIFNLGHGILPNTPVEKVKFLVDIIKGVK